MKYGIGEAHKSFNVERRGYGVFIDFTLPGVGLSLMLRRPGVKKITLERECSWVPGSWPRRRAEAAKQAMQDWYDEGTPNA